MCEQKQITGTCFVGVRRDRRIDVAVLVEMRVGDAHRLQLLGQQAAEIFLLLGRGQVGEAGSDWVSMTT